MIEVEEFILQYEGEQREVMLFLHSLLEQELNLISKLQYKIPFYYRKSWICYMNPLKNGAVEFAFTRGNELSNSQGLLIDKGRKQVSSIEFKKVADIPDESLNEVIHEAILLDETVPYASKRNMINN